MIAAILGAMLLQADTGDELKRAAQHLERVVQSMEEAAGPDREGKPAKESRLSALERSIEDQQAALKIVDDLLKKMSEGDG